jgi:uncharacterized protein (DUF983 family)
MKCPKCDYSYSIFNAFWQKSIICEGCKTKIDVNIWDSIKSLNPFTIFFFFWLVITYVFNFNNIYMDASLILVVTIWASKAIRKHLLKNQ